jgi:branched-chain amino acid transport system ATP-binding protein
MLDVRGLTVEYGHVEAVREVSFHVAQGSIVSLVGPNGAGKTTILNAISGVVPATHGSIRFQGRDITHASRHRRVAEGIVQIPEGRLVLANMTVQENLELGAFHRPARETRATIAAMEERFPILAERRKSLAGTLSGGEQQMLAIARGLMAKPKLLLLDEPSLGLAPLLVQTIFEIVGELHSEGLTILLVEQNARQALSVSSHGYVMESGKIVLEGSAKELMADQAVIDFYLGQVQTPAGTDGVCPAEVILD